VLVAMSGFADAVLCEEASALGAAYLIKPIDFGQLTQCLG
jgi:hypothetical protein